MMAYMRFGDTFVGGHDPSWYIWVGGKHPTVDRSIAIWQPAPDGLPWRGQLSVDGARELRDILNDFLGDTPAMKQEEETNGTA